MNISLFKTAMDTVPEKNINFYSFLSFIKDGKWEDYAHEVRNGKRDKKTMPAVTPSGVFTKRNAASIDQHSGIISIDIDIKDNEAADIEGLEQDPYTWAVHHSIGGYGWVAYFKIEPEKHLQAYYGLEKYLADNYKVIADKACKDVSRLRYVSYDPDLYQSKNEPKAFKLYVKDITKELELTDVVAFDSDYQYIIEQIQEKRIDLTAGGYHDWLQIGFSLANGLGEKGRDVYHIVSEQNLNYNKKETDRKYDECLKSDVGLTRLNTFFYFCSKAKIKTQSETTKTIFSVVQAAKSRYSQSPAQQKESAYKLLQKEGYEGSEVVLTVEKGFEIDIKSKKKFKSSGTDTDQIIEILADRKIRFNLVTRAMEIDGKNLTDREFNSVYVDINQQTGKTMGSQLVSSIIDSEWTPSYDPFTEYLAQAELKTTGNIAKLCKSIIYKDNTNGNMEVLVEKWLLGIIASMSGTYSITVLVLTGAQGVGKTNFFRNLLPSSLRKYYAESKLDAGKDDFILMCNKLIICDDEFGGKSKKEEKLLKDLTAKQVFSVRPPYQKRNIDMNRYAVLCGTSNNEDLLNDLTGNRRIIPIGITGIDWDLFNEIDKDELFCELYVKFKNSGDYWQLNQDDISALDIATVENKIVCYEEELLLRYFKEPGSDGWRYMTNTDILDVISRDSKQRLSAQKLGQVLKRHGQIRVVKSINGQKHGVYQMRQKSDVEPTVAVTE